MVGTYWQPEPVRCPFCIQRNEFRVVVDLTAGMGRYLLLILRVATWSEREKREFHCLCGGRRKLEGDAIPLQHAREVSAVSNPKNATRSKTSHSEYLVVALGLLLGALTLALYSPASGNPFLNYDDPSYVTENAHVRVG